MAYNPFSKQAKAVRAQLRGGGRIQQAARKGAPRPPVLRLVACGIYRDGQLYQGQQSHYQLRQSLGWPDPAKGLRTDTAGFMDSEGNFLSRKEAVQVGIAAGQLDPAWATAGRELLSSDIRW